MNIPVAILQEDEALVAELHRLGVRHLARLRPVEPAPPRPPADLIVELARHPQARFRASLILLFLRRPHFCQFVAAALARLDPAAANTLRLYYQAAVYLQRELRPQLRPLLRPLLDEWRDLPDDFSSALGLPPADSADPASALSALGQAHQRLTGWAYNWSGAYRQHIPVFLKHLQRDHT